MTISFTPGPYVVLLNAVVFGIALFRRARLRTLRNLGGVMLVVSAVVWDPLCWWADWDHCRWSPGLAGPLASMKSELRNLVLAQESYFTDSGTFATSLPSTLFEVTPGVQITILAASDSGFRAVASHTITDRQCAIYVGPVGQPPARREGEPGCTCASSLERLRGLCP